MNWTGGRLQRQVKVAKTLQDKQKQHFANVRTGLQNDRGQHNDFVPSFMQDDVYQGSASRQRGRPSPARQSRLEDYTQIAPVAHRLQSLTPRAGNRPSRPLKQSTIRTNGHHKHERHRATSTPGGPYEQQDSRTQQSESLAPGSTTIGLSHVPDVHRQPTIDTLDHQKRRLLAQSDWLGLDRSRPLQMDFASDRGRERVAKRRKLDVHDRMREQQAQQQRSRVPSIGDRCMMRGALQPNDAPERDSIRIRIGDAALISQTDAASRAQGKRPRSTSADSLLVDDSLSQRILNSTSARFDLRLLSDDDSSEVSSARSRNAEKQHADRSKSSDRSSPNPMSAEEVDQVMEDATDDDERIFDDASDTDERITETRSKDPTIEQLQAGPPLTATAYARRPLLASPTRTLASTRRAVHGSIFSFVGSSVGNGQARNLRGPVTNANDEDLWRRYMNVYDEGTTQPSTSAPSTTAFTNLRRGKPAKATDETVPVEKRAVPSRFIGIPSSVARPRPKLQEKPERHELIAHRADTDHRYREAATPAHVEQTSKPGTKATTDPKPNTTMPLSRPKPKLDPDAAWKAFVFGDEDDGSSSSMGPTGWIGSKYDATQDKLQKTTTQAATAGSSSLLTTSSGMGPPTPKKMNTAPAQDPSSTSSNFPFDRPSSLANASTTATVLHRRYTVDKQRRRGTYSPPKKLQPREGARDENVLDEIEDE